MVGLISIIIILGVLITLGSLYTAFKTKIDFFVTGIDSKFSLYEINMLWNVAQMCEIEQPTSLFWSLTSLTKCMAQITSNQQSVDSDPKQQRLVTKLFDFRTKLQNDSDNKKGLDSTMYLDKGQRLRILLPGRGIFASRILNNGREIFISVPRQKDMIPITAEEWVGKVVSVYLWRQGDAAYCFDTTVIGHGLFIGESCISLKHTTTLVRTQKRKSVRAKCDINAQMYIIKKEIVDYNAVETQQGYKCKIEDISESGAMIRIGGKGVANIQLKLQFNIQNMLIIMFGVVRTVEYNQEINESLLHFECVHIEPGMKNEVLRFVYNLLPEKEKEVYEAIKLSTQDAEGELEDDSAEATSSTVSNSDSVTNDENKGLNDRKENTSESNQEAANASADLHSFNNNDEDETPLETLNIF